MRCALLAIDVWKLTIARTAVSSSCASASGAVTRTIGSFGKNGVPSRIAQTSPVNRKSRR
jgi:hypothetical protein